jgi:hypothetical protein
MSRSLPEHPNLVHLKKQARDLLRCYRRGDAVAVERLSSQVASGSDPQLADAQYLIAREYGFESWTKLKRQVESAVTARSIWFPEPSVEDDSIAQHNEDTYQWLSRSTSAKAKGCRRFLNENINLVPLEWQSKLHNDFRTKEWSNVFFELIVARTLQLLGASIEVEAQIAETGKRPDFIARFPDGEVTVEATIPEINEEMNRQSAENEELVQIIEAFTPAAWTVSVWRLPRLGPNDSKKDFKRMIREIFGRLPASPGEDQEPIEVELNYGEFMLTISPGRKGNRAAVVRGMASGADDTEQKIRAIVNRKKKQVRGATTPVLLAVNTSPFGEREDYDRALFGLTFERVDQRGKMVATGFDPVGVFGANRPEAPTCAGVLAFTEVGFPGVADPVLYLHPRFNGSLPDSLKKLERRSYRHGSGISVEQATINNVMSSLGFVSRLG